MKTSKPSALIVDDEALISMYLADLLDEMGFEAITAGTGEEALIFLDGSRTFTVAFVDLGLPGISGLELIAELNSRMPDLPVVIASGYGQMASRDVDDNNHGPAVLSKPYDGEKVVRVLKELRIHIPDLPESG